MADNHRKSIKRSILVDVLPLDTPYVVHIDVSSACNFNCKFCFHSLAKKKLNELGFFPRIMDFDLFKLTVNSIKGFPKRLKRLCLIRHGEALLNKNLPNMIRYAKMAGIAEKINISTNGSLLTPEINHELIDSGLDEMLVSIEALSNEKYKKVCGVNICFDKMIRNIEHFYKNKKQCTLCVKIMDCALSAGDEEKFHYVFDNICDKASVEYIIPCFRGVDYSTIISNNAVNIMGDDFIDVSVCPQPFFQMHIFPNGNISVCNADYTENIIFSNVKDNSLVDVWKGNEWNKFRVMHLEGKRKYHPYCSFCAGNVCYSSESDVLDKEAKNLIKCYE